MKKIFLLIFLFCALLIISAPILIKAQGLVPCGNGSPFILDSNGFPTSQPNPDFKACTICDFFKLLANIYDFIVKMIATPLAVLAFIIGALLMLVSAGNPNTFGLGKKIIYAAIIGLVLVFCSWLIIDFILHAVGYSQNWSSLDINC